MPYPNITLLKRRRTKIVATLGPATESQEAIEQLIAAGVNVFRLNMSHGDHATHRRAFRRVRAAAAAGVEPVAVLADLCGPKIRVGRFPGGQVVLEEGTRVTVTTRDVPGSAVLIPSQYAGLADDVRPGCRILLSDGLLTLRVESVEATEVVCTVIHGGVLKDRKGINLPDVEVSAPALTDKDRADAAFAVGLGVDFLALSFVRRAADVEELRELLPSVSPPHVIAKIERPEALQEIDALLDVSDGIMVARGDLGVELPPAVVPVVQRELIAAARGRHKPVIVATQMLESMIEHPQPTRAEVQDIASAVFSGADAVMLSAETASGRYPLRAVEMMDQVARQAEGCLWTEGAFQGIPHEEELPVPLPVHVALAHATSQLSRDLLVRAIVVVSSAGATAEVVSAARPAAPIAAVTSSDATARRMALLWGVIPRQVSTEELAQPQGLARRLVLELGLAASGQYILEVSGFSTVPEVNAPCVTVLQVP